MGHTIGPEEPIGQTHDAEHAAAFRRHKAPKPAGGNGAILARPDPGAPNPFLALPGRFG